jgi:putative flavoprotein involved in K+ transport
MAVETVGTLVIGAGQAGVAMSEHLTKAGINHVVLEKSRIAERWRTGRWDSLVANGPAWHDRFPGMEFSTVGPDEFAPKEQVANYFEAYAQKFNAPIRCGVQVTSLSQSEGGTGFRAETSTGPVEADHVVLATGAFQQPLIPALVPTEAGLTQIHSHDYRNPGQLPAGAVLVVGCGSSGSQIATELLRAGRKVFLSMGPHNKPPRAYRGKDFVWWLGVLGHWKATAPRPGMEHVTIAVSGANGGQTVDFRKLARDGMTLLGRTQSYSHGILRIADDLQTNLRHGDDDYLSVLDAADAYATEHQLDMPLEPDARTLLPDPDCVTNPVRQIDVKAVGITSIIWATGFSQDFSWVKLDAFDARGNPQHTRGVSSVRGLYFLGLPWLSNRSSSFIWGVWNDAKFLSEKIASAT